MRAESRGFAALTAVLAASALANPWLGPVRTGGSTTRGPAGGEQAAATGAFGGGVALVAWHAHLADSDQAVVAATVLRPDGASSTPFGLRLSSGADDEYPEAVAFDGSNFLVVWTGAALFATRVSPQGVPLDSPGVALAGPPSYGAAVAFDGTNYLVVWSKSGASYDIVGVRVSAQGVVLDSAPLLISSASGEDELWPRVAAAGSGFFVTWTVQATGVPGEVRGAPVSAAGVAGSEVTLSTSGTRAGSPAIAAFGSGYLVAWEEDPGDVLGRVVPPNGQPGGPAFPISATNDDEGHPSVAFDGSSYLVAWENDTTCGLKLARVSTSGAVLDAPPLTSTAGGYEVEPTVLAGGAGERLLLWQDWRSGDEDIYVSRLDAQGRTQDASGLPVVVTAPRHTGAGVGTTAGKAVVAWASLGSGVYAVEALLDDGQTATPVVLPASAQARKEAVVAGGAAAALVAFRQQADVVAVRVSGTGQALDATPINISGSDSASQPAVAWDGAGWLVVWVDERSGSRDIYGARLAADGAVSPPGGRLLVSGAGADWKYPAVACLDSRCLVTVFDANEERASAMLVDPQTPGTLVPLSATPSRQRPAVVASDGAGFMVVWQDSRSAWGLYGTRVSATGGVVDPLSFRVAYGGALANPALAWDGQRYLVAFDVAWGERLDVMGLWLEPTGVVSSELPFPLATGATPNTRARAAALGPGRFALAWSRYDDTDGLDTLRVATRRVLAVSQGQACAGQEECTSGYCVDGVCCDGACGGGQADCQACSVAAGAAVDGTCAVARAGAVCRASGGECDVEETCDGTATTCGSDAARPDGVACTGGVCGGGVCLRTDRPLFTSVPEASLSCGKAWGYSAGGGTPTVSGAGPFTFSVRMADGTALPEGLTLDVETGALSWVPGAEQAGEYELELTVTSPTGSDAQRLRVEVVCKPANLGVGCTAAPVGVGWALFALSLLPRRRKARAGR
ncbi:MAG: putative Ig domain-containing protein [Myxococcales bacterium]|nr:putative Ig domain-containing protein [Myxococcales bacterium]